MHNHITKCKTYSCLRFSLNNVSILNHSKVGRCVSIVHRLLRSLLCLLTSLWSIIARLQPAMYWISEMSVEDCCSFSNQNFRTYHVNCIKENVHLFRISNLLKKYQSFSMIQIALVFGEI
jgi:hypothetical protein